MKTKRHLLATSGATVDGRTILPERIVALAKSYNPKTYTARLDIEHYLSPIPGSEFCAQGDVLELDAEEVEVDFNGKKEKRMGLFGILDVTDDAKKLNEAGKKVFPSIHFVEDFGGKGYPYLMRCAFTDTPACIGTERLKFNRQLPTEISVSSEDSHIDAYALEFDEAETGDVKEQIGGFFKTLTDTIKSFGKAPEPEPKPEVKPEDGDQTAAFTAFATTLTAGLEKTLTSFAETQQAAQTALRTDFNALKELVESTANPNQPPRPKSDGGGQFSKTDC